VPTNGLSFDDRAVHRPFVPIRTKRWNEEAEPEDGYRLLICRYRPRGVRKEDEPWDAWCQALAPSAELHAAVYGKTGEPLPWPEYERRFMDEMSRQRFWIESFASRVREGQTLTLLCSSACVDPARCHRTLVKRLIEDAAFPSPRSPSGEPRVVRRKPA
jgi:uncharacterized protein YeaO (DUF488 family)